MKILFCTPYRTWDMGRFVEKAFRKLGHEIKVYDYRTEAKVLNLDLLSQYQITRTLGINKSNRKLKRVIKKFKPDMFFVLKGEIIKPETIKWIKETFKIPAVLWFGDDPHLFHTMSRKLAPLYDYVFTSSQDAVKWHKELGVKNVQWIGFACDPELHKNMELSDEDKIKYGSDICFVGVYYKEREELFKKLTSYNFKIFGRGWKDKEIIKNNPHIYGGEGLYLNDMMKAFNASKIILNMHDVQQKHGGLKATFRVYEVTGCRGFLLTDKPYGIEEQFEINKEIVCYESTEELKEKIDYYLENSWKRENIAKAGQLRTYKDHTFEHRAKQIIDFVFKDNI
ncbi:MAG: hypothetical protein A2252_07420 [Elusimicrobia bacterium RIFOXYA2_FULL_39_19]|nr:MAG: hypothetical protein A2252_07420 [Elusimicrobia bacterium RIFOXYA2_FULL_39_19]